MRQSIWFALIATFMIVNPVIFWNEINWLRGLLIYFELVVIFVAWLSWKLSKAHYEKKAYYVMNNDVKGGLDE